MLFSAADTSGSWQITSSPGASTAYVAVSGGVEIMAFTATLGFEEGCTILSYDGVNAFNSIHRHRFLPR